MHRVSNYGNDVSFNLNTVYFGIMPRETGWLLHEFLAQPTRSLFESNKSATYYHCQFNFYLPLLKMIVANDHWQLGHMA